MQTSLIQRPLAGLYTPSRKPAQHASAARTTRCQALPELFSIADIAPQVLTFASKFSDFFLGMQLAKLTIACQ